VAGQLDATSAAIEELPANDLFQSQHLLANGRLSPGDRGSGPAHTPMSNHSEKRAQQAEFQIPSLHRHHDWLDLARSLAFQIVLWLTLNA
jgi:hypothetical protein